MSLPRLVSRVACPCCGYPTLSERAAYEICELCNWEDDGQGDQDAEEVLGGPNSDYLLSEARQNFKLYRVMYAPGRDQRLTGPDTQLQYDVKGQLMAVFSKALLMPESESKKFEAEIAHLENELREETTRRVRAYERAHRGA